MIPYIYIHQDFKDHLYDDYREISKHPGPAGHVTSGSSDTDLLLFEEITQSRITELLIPIGKSRVHRSLQRY